MKILEIEEEGKLLFGGDDVYPFNSQNKNKIICFNFKKANILPNKGCIVTCNYILTGLN